MKIKIIDLRTEIEVRKLIFIMNFSVLDFFKFASRMPQTAQILVSTFKIFRGSMPPDSPRYFLFFFPCLGNKIPILLNFDTVTFLWLLPIGLKSMLYLYQNIFCCCTRIYIYIYIYIFFFFFFFLTEVSQLTVAVRWLGTFANILFFFYHQNDIFNFENGQVNVWSKHKACWLANIWFSCSRMLFFVMTYWKNLQLLGALPPDPYQGLCPWTPLGAYCGPQTPASFSSFFTFSQSHVCTFCAVSCCTINLSIFTTKTKEFPYGRFSFRICHELFLALCHAWCFKFWRRGIGSYVPCKNRFFFF